MSMATHFSPLTAILSFWVMATASPVCGHEKSPRMTEAFLWSHVDEGLRLLSKMSASDEDV